MGLFNKDGTPQKGTESPVDDLSFLEEAAGAGLEHVKDIRVVSYLNIAADLSESVKMGLAKPGDFFIAGPSINLGQHISVLPLDVKPIWTERDQSFNVANWEPGEVEVTYKRDGNRKSKWMANGHEVIDNLLFALLIRGQEELGPTIFQAGLGNMKVCTKWVTQLSFQRLPSGAKGPIFSRWWGLNSVQVASKTAAKQGTMYNALGAPEPLDFIIKEYYLEVAKPMWKKSSEMLLEDKGQVGLPEPEGLVSGTEVGASLA